MRAINSAQLMYALTCGNGFYAPKLTTLRVAPPASNQAFITPALASADTVNHSGYVIQLSAQPYDGASPPRNGLAGRSFKAAGDPIAPANVRFFATNAGGTIYEDVTTMWTSISEVANRRPVIRCADSAIIRTSCGPR